MGPCAERLARVIDKSGQRRSARRRVCRPKTALPLHGLRLQDTCWPIITKRAGSRFSERREAGAATWLPPIVWHDVLWPRGLAVVAPPCRYAGPIAKSLPGSLRSLTATKACRFRCKPCIGIAQAPSKYAGFAARLLDFPERRPQCPFDAGLASGGYLSPPSRKGACRLGGQLAGPGRDRLLGGPIASGTLDDRQGPSRKARCSCRSR